VPIILKAAILQDFRFVISRPSICTRFGRALKLDNVKILIKEQINFSPIVKIRDQRLRYISLTISVSLEEKIKYEYN